MPKSARQAAAEIVRDAGGQIVGRTKLQKVAYFLEVVGLGDGFHFRYLHFGPYSDDLADAIEMAEAFDLVTEEERRATWGGHYSIFTATAQAGERDHGQRARFAEAASRMDSIELELAATAAYLRIVEEHDDPWAETARLKPDKAENGRLDKAKTAYRALTRLEVPNPLPAIV